MHDSCGEKTWDFNKVCIYMHAYTRAHSYIHMNLVCVHVCINRSYTFMNSYAYGYASANYTRTYIHTHTHIHTYSTCVYMTRWIWLIDTCNVIHLAQHVGIMHIHMHICTQILIRNKSEPDWLMHARVDTLQFLEYQLHLLSASDALQVWVRWPVKPEFFWGALCTWVWIRWCVQVDPLFISFK
jgi:hypothetical protein